MATFPTSLPTTSTIPVEAAGTTLATNHVVSHQGAQDEIIAIATKVGVDGSAVTTTHDYKLGEITSTDKAVGKTATQTLTNKTLTAAKVPLGSDAVGDMRYTSNADGTQTRIPVGTDNFIMKLNGTTPGWEAEAVTVDASTTVKGIVEAATAGEVTAGTATGATGAVLAVTPDALAASTPVFNGSGLTNILFCKNGSTTHDMSLTTTTTIAHGLGRTPQLVKIHVNQTLGDSSSSLHMVSSIGSYDGSTQNCNYIAGSTNGATLLSGADTSNCIHYGYGATTTADSDKLTGAVSVDATNITITWTKTNNPTGTGNVHWEVIGH